MTEHEYAFEMKLWAVVRVKAQDEQRARRTLNEIVDRIEVPGSRDLPCITELTLSTGVDDAFLFEIDGVDPTDADEVEFSNDCELAAYLFVLAGFNVRVNNTRDLHIKSVEDDGMRLCDYDDDLLDYSDVPSTLWSWDEIDEIFVY